MGPGGRAERAVRREKKIKIATGTTMASAARGKAMARRVDEWVSETAASASRGLVVLSPVPFPGDDESDEQRERADSNESGSDASVCRSPEYGTGGLNDNDSITEDEQSEEQEKRSLQEEEEEEEEDECAEWEDKSQESETELEVAGGGYPGFKDNSKKSNTKPSPSVLCVECLDWFQEKADVGFY